MRSILFGALCLSCIGFVASLSADGDASMQAKIQAFLEKEANTLSIRCPYFLNLFKNGTRAENKAGLRISETKDQLGGMLTEQLFYYALYDHGQRVPHWHANAVESGIVLNGTMKITIWDGPGNYNVFTVNAGGAWMIPQASVHCLENMGGDELDFLVAYNSGEAADRDFVTAWAALPDSILEKTLGLSQEEIKGLKKTTVNRLSTFDPEMSIEGGASISSPYSIPFDAVTPLYETSLGSIKRVDETNWPSQQYMALQYTLMKPGVIREPHWYTTSDVVLFIQKGKMFFSMMDSEGKSYNVIGQKGDLIFLPVGTFHTYVNVGGEDLEVYESFNSSKPLGEIGILDAAQHFRPATLAGATGLSVSSIEKISKQKMHVYMTSL